MPAVVSKLSNLVILTVAAGACFASTFALIYILRKKADDDIYEKYDVINTSRHAVIEVPVPSDIIGSVIGRNGANVARIQESTSTRINFRDEVKGSSLRVAIIRGKPNDAQAAERLLKMVIAERMNITTLEMKIPIKACGYVIGKNGSNIRMIRNTSNTKLNLESSAGDHDFRILTIIGSPEQIELAKNLVEESVAKATSLDKESRELSLARRQINYVSGQLCLTSSGETAVATTEQRPRVEKLVPTGVDGFLEVFVSAVESPHRFWVQPLGNHATNLDKLVEEMTDFYGQTENFESHRLQQVAVSDLVAAPFTYDKSWYRGRVLSNEVDDYDVENSTVEVYYVDFGEAAKFKMRELCSLKQEFLQMSFQANECRLADVKPKGGGDTWDDAAVKQFEQLTYCAQWKYVMAKVVREDCTTEPSVKIVQLVDTQSAVDVNVAAELVRQELAEPIVNTTE